MVQKNKISGCLKTALLFVLQQCKNQVSFKRNGSTVVIKVLLIILKGQRCCLITREDFLPFKKRCEDFNTMAEPFFGTSSKVTELKFLNRNSCKIIEAKSIYGQEILTKSYILIDPPTISPTFGIRTST